MDLRLAGKRALVTGSSGGIGEGIAKALAEEGVAVVVHGRNRKHAERVALEIEAGGGKALVTLGDLATDDGAGQVAEKVLSTLGGVDILVNNAGEFPYRGWVDAQPSQWTEAYNTNVVSMVRMVRLLAPQMKALGWGRIIQLASTVATTPPPPMPDYSASKAATLNLTVSLARELAGAGITVNTVSPGPIVTPGYIQLISGVAAGLGWGTEWSEIERRLLEGLKIPCGRLGRVEDVAHLVTFLASPLAGYINGANLRVDGGLTPAIN